MSVISGEGREALSFIEQLVMQEPAFAAIIFNGTAMIVNFNRMGSINVEAIGQRADTPYHHPRHLNQAIGISVLTTMTSQPHS